MDTERIISFKNGTLYLKLREEFLSSSMKIRCAMARIDRNGLEIVKNDSSLDVTATHLTLNRQEMKLIAEGYEMVRYFWTEQPLAPRHVLLSCGCIIDWDLYLKQAEEMGCTISTGDKELWCSDHEEVKVSRFNADDWKTPDEIAELVEA